MNSLRRARLCALVLIIALVAGVAVAGRHAVALAMSSTSDTTALAGQDIVICSNGVFKTIRLDADGKPVDPDSEPMQIGPCTVCTALTVAGAPLDPHPIATAPTMFDAAGPAPNAAGPEYRITLGTVPIRAPPSFS